MRRTFLFAAASLLVIVLDARALTTPLTGATVYPAAAPPLRLPFPAGARVYVLAGYGPSAGSSLHSNLTDPTHGNDYYALDLNYDGQPNGGRGMPIVAAIAGTVVRAGWASSGWANFGQRIILRHDLGDGHVCHTQYAHLNAIAPGIVEGTTVAQGQVLGELGGSCQGALSCASFSTPHLHFSMHRDSSIGGSGTGGSYGGNAVVPEPIDGYEDLVRGRVLVSMNTGTSGCGDDCPVCAPIPSAGRDVDESEVCFSRAGNPAYWYDELDGFEGSLLWTHATDSSSADNYGVWELAFDESGTYRLEVYTDGSWAQARQARYAIVHAGTTSYATLDQSAADGWRSLGEHAFASGAGQRVRLDDNTGEALSLQRRLVFDAIRLTRSVVTMQDAGVAAEDGGVVMHDAGATLDVGESIMADAGAIRDAGARTSVAPGCGCRAAQGHPSAWWLVALLLLSQRRWRGVP